MKRIPPSPAPRSHADGIVEGRYDHAAGIPRRDGNATDTDFWRGWREGWDDAEQQSRVNSILRLYGHGRPQA